MANNIGEKEVCPCGNDTFKVFYRSGAGGSGSYITLICKSCQHEISYDFDNPNYDG